MLAEMFNFSLQRKVDIEKEDENAMFASSSIVANKPPRQPMRMKFNPKELSNYNLQSTSGIYKKYTVNV